MSHGALVHVLDHAKVLKAHQLIIVRLANHATDSGLSWPSHSLLARETGYTRVYVVRVIHDLIEQGAIKEVFNMKGRRRYQLHVYDFKKKRCSCEQPADEYKLSTQLPKSACKLSSAGVNSAACKSSQANENAAEPLTEEPEKRGAHAHEETERPRSRPQDVDPTFDADLKAIVARLKF
jgi:DNA-binding MarR family transcriptional regulator